MNTNSTSAEPRSPRTMLSRAVARAVQALPREVFADRVNEARANRAT
jgi:hypothetical protein